VIIACGICLLSKEGEFHILFGRLKDNRQKCFKCFKMGILKYENFRVIAHRQSKEEYTYKVYKEKEKMKGYSLNTAFICVQTRNMFQLYILSPTTRLNM
jgi:hypothetical protein